MGVPPEQTAAMFCEKNGIYLHRMNDALLALVREAWAGKDEPELGMLRYFTVRLLHELLSMPTESEPDIYFTRSQIAIVKDAEALILSDLSKRITAKELADRFGVSESSFKFYVKGILGESYLSYFRKKRMEKAAELLESTTMRSLRLPMQWAMRTKANSPRYLQKHTVCRRWSSDGCRSECRFP